MIRSNQYGQQSSQPSGLMMAPGGKQTQQQQNWYKSQRPQAQPTPILPQQLRLILVAQAQTQRCQTTTTVRGQQCSLLGTQDSATQDAINNTMAQGHAV